MHAGHCPGLCTHSHTHCPHGAWSLSGRQVLNQQGPKFDDKCQSTICTEGRFQVIWVGKVERFPDTGGNQGRLPWGSEAAAETCQRKGERLMLALRVDPRVRGKLEIRPKQRFCFTSFVVTQTSSKGTLKKRENGFRSLCFLPPQTWNWTEWRKFNVKLLTLGGLIN